MALEKFHYTLGGVEIVAPRLDQLPMGFARKARKVPNAEKMFVLFEMLFAEDSPEMAALDAMLDDDAEKFMQAWADASDVSLGESSPS